MLKLNYYSLDGKLESKDSLVARVWYRDKAYPFKPCMLESVVYRHVHGSVLLSFSYSDFALMLFCSCVSLSPSLCKRFLRSASLGQGTILDQRVIISTNHFYSLPSA
jgi:hypothetical protein